MTGWNRVEWGVTNCAKSPEIGAFSIKIIHWWLVALGEAFKTQMKYLLYLSLLPVTKGRRGSPFVGTLGDL